MSMNYGYYTQPFQYSTQAFDPRWDYTDEYVETDSSPVQAQQFFGFGPGFGGFFGGPFGFGFGRPFFGGPFFFRRPFWGWGGWI